MCMCLTPSSLCHHLILINKLWVVIFLLSFGGKENMPFKTFSKANSNHCGYNVEAKALLPQNAVPVIVAGSKTTSYTTQLSLYGGNMETINS